MGIVATEGRECGEEEEGELTHSNTGECKGEGLLRCRGGFADVSTLEKRRKDPDETKESTILLRKDRRGRQTLQR